MAEHQDRWTLYACDDERCRYARMERSSGVHQTADPSEPFGPLVRHPLSPVEVMPVEEHEREIAALRKAVEDARAAWTDCPDASFCKDCPCAADDDVCFPGERLRAELEACNHNWKRALEELKSQDAEVERLRTVTDEQVERAMRAASVYGYGPGEWPRRMRAALEAALQSSGRGDA